MENRHDLSRLEQEGDEREPDLRGPAVIVEGSVLGGFNFTGPFEHIEAANQWHQERSLAGALGLPCTVILLVNPTHEAIRKPSSLSKCYSDATTTATENT